jgi:hypothetical protein
VESRIADLEGGVGGLLVASGQAAETLAILTIAEAGDTIVASPSLYGGTFNLFRHTLPKLGVTVNFVENPDDPESWRAAADENTKLFFGETIPNPKGDILDIEAVSAVAHEIGVPLIVDNTVATPYVLNPIKHGASPTSTRRTPPTTGWSSRTSARPPSSSRPAPRACATRAQRSPPSTPGSSARAWRRSPCASSVTWRTRRRSPSSSPPARRSAR